MDKEILIRLGAFFGVLVVMAVWELVFPKRELTTSKTLRWSSNLALTVFNSVVIKFLLPAGAMGAAMIAEYHGWGLMQLITVGFWWKVAITIVLLDFIIYLQHVLFHALPILWRLHMVHHADLDIDVTTGLRFHTIEIFISMMIKIIAVVLIGPPVFAVMLFEIILNATAMFNHANVRLPGWLDRFLRLFLVTPDMHRVHHSVIKQETNSNYGFNLPWWDYICGTYTKQPSQGHQGMTIGLNQFRELRVVKLVTMLLLPFTGKVGEYPVNR